MNKSEMSQGENENGLKPEVLKLDSILEKANIPTIEDIRQEIAEVYSQEQNVQNLINQLEKIAEKLGKIKEITTNVRNQGKEEPYHYSIELDGETYEYTHQTWGQINKLSYSMWEFANKIKEAIDHLKSLEDL